MNPTFPLHNEAGFFKASEDADPLIAAVAEDPVANPVPSPFAVNVFEAVEVGLTDGKGVASIGVGSDIVALNWLKERSAWAVFDAYMLMVVVVVTWDESTVLMDIYISNV
jgi:hypothetical protein